MKPTEYIEKYNLDKSSRFSHSDFIADLTSDFIALLEINKADNNLKGFDNALRCVKMKFDAIKAKTGTALNEKLWNFFFATVVAPMRETMCPKDMEVRRRANEAKRLAREAWKKSRDAERQWENDFYSDLFSRFFKTEEKPINELILLQLNHVAEITANVVNKAYRELAKTHHPDKGGNQEAFIAITNAKNRCLSWLTRNA